MDIKGKITGIDYAPRMVKPLSEPIDFEQWDINRYGASNCVQIDGQVVGISKWVSPKRTRTYPYARVYDTLNNGKVITVIPVVKDEGAAGDRDFLQWDTVSLLSLLNVFVILAYYDRAAINSRHSQKITNQKFPAGFVKEKIRKIVNYRSSALHWNLDELKQISELLTQAKISYQKIARQTKVDLHAYDEYDKRAELFQDNIQDFMQFSRLNAEAAQKRESVTLQPKENLASSTKAIITIGNYLGGLYHLTVDEVKISKNGVELIESKHTARSRLPMLGDIKDGFLKMMLFANLSETFVDGKIKSCCAVLLLTSSQIQGKISSGSSQNKINEFLSFNQFSSSQQNKIKLIFDEGNTNQFEVRIEGRS